MIGRSARSRSRSDAQPSRVAQSAHLEPARVSALPLAARAKGATMHRTRSPLELQVIASQTVPIATGGTFSPTTATILTGPKEAVLVDTLYAPAEVGRLAEMIAATGKKLTTIYITHAHFDHYFGLALLLSRFPDARGVALPRVAEIMRETHEVSWVLASQGLSHNIVDADVLTEQQKENTIPMYGKEVHPIESGQADI